jgi:hypothetical protein
MSHAPYLFAFGVESVLHDGSVPTTMEKETRLRSRHQLSQILEKSTYGKHRYTRDEQASIGAAHRQFADRCDTSRLT